MTRTSIWPILSDVPHELKYVQAGKWRTRVVDAGQGDPLILMHGSGGHLEAYARNIGPLSGNLRVIAFDFAGHGFTTHAVTNLEIDDYVDQLAALLDAMDVETAHISGESLGGWVAVKFATRFPKRVAKMVLNTPGGTMANPNVMKRIQTLSQQAANDPTVEAIRERLEWLMADPKSVTDELVEMRQYLYSRPGFSRSMASILCLQEPEIRTRNMIRDQELQSIPQETMVIWTSNDPSGPAKTGMHMAKLLPNGRFEYIDRAGHWPQWERPERYNELLSDFLFDR